MRFRRPRTRALLSWALVIGLVTLAGCASAQGMGTDSLVDPQDALAPAGPVARAQDDLWNTIFPIAVVVFVFVEGLIIYATVRFRARPGDDRMPKQIAGNTRLELIWTMIPAVILAGIAVPTVQTIFEQAGEPPDALQVTVRGKQYWWEFEYPTMGGVRTANELRIPTGQPVFLRMESTGQASSDPAGVIHSFWVPRLAGKQDVVPSHIRTMTIQADAPGTYAGQCAEFCGLSHARMKFTVIAEEPAAFNAWMSGQQAPAATANVGRGAELFTQRQCIGCHALNGYPNAEAQVGPSLTHFAEREIFAGGTLPNTDEAVASWLRNPQAVKPGSQMPNLGLSEPDVADLTAYLRTLR